MKEEASLRESYQTLGIDSYLDCYATGSSGHEASRFWYCSGDRPNSSIVTALAFLVLGQEITRTVESFFVALKTELLVNAHPYQTRQEVRTRSLSIWRGFPIGPTTIYHVGLVSRGEFEQRAAQSTTLSTRPWEVHNTQTFNDL